MPATGVSPKVVFRVKLLVSRLAGAISSLNVTVTCVLVAATASCAGTCCVTVGGVLSVLEPVSNDQTKAPGKAMPSVSCAPVVMVAVMGPGIMAARFKQAGIMGAAREIGAEAG